MEILTLIAALTALAFVFTIIFCRWRMAKKRKPSFLLAIGGAACTAITTLFVIYGRDLFTRGFWDDDKAPMAIMVPFVFCFCLAVSLAPALLVVQYYRAKFSEGGERD
jgi:hypothetical protein